ncbi:MAG: MBL fold hydrolase [Bacteroidetes bacterium HGW-Bacteroidetes-7]|jgi:7,8-dihydropterin-6-yl-methyl-4-(beta-D-ribofuranosyl)aminobenzene 5'-phosphate synthase|nr:MAG: MBL fold hydrolase [Bacteroidetes bacterium HGW-Bacteroidetes-7]
MKIITLIENYAIDRGILAEHGLSMYIETHLKDGTIDKRILFDTGQSGTFIQNARKLGVETEKIDSVIISHGHYDHGGGLSDFLKINKKAKVYLKKESLDPKYDSKKGIISFIPDGELMEGRVIEVSDIMNVGESLYILPDIKIVNKEDTGFIERDEFPDELFLTAVHNQKLIILSSCSHRGITNIASSAVTHFKLPIKSIIGGFHTINDNGNRVDFIIEKLKSYEPESIGICHCTGIEQYCKIKASLPETNVFYNYSGKITNL